KGDKGKSDKGLIAESFDWDDKSVSSEDKGTTKFKAFMAMQEMSHQLERADVSTSKPALMITSDFEDDNDNQEVKGIKNQILIPLDTSSSVSHVSSSKNPKQKVQMENLNDTKVKQLRSDNKIEFRNHTLEAFCDEKGISQNFSSPCTPEQNGMAKRRNRTLIEAARTMLNSASLLK
nr:putative ribonuclease H-like domain-containing protein [Tanacetum cinerariifolium]